jgi:hypothetical protein
MTLVMGNDYAGLLGIKFRWKLSFRAHKKTLRTSVTNFSLVTEVEMRMSILFEPIGTSRVRCHYPKIEGKGRKIAIVTSH